MKYSAAVLSLAAVAVARPAFTNLVFDVTEGEPFTLEFTGCEGGCTINLKDGQRGDLQDVQELTSSAEGGSFTFTLDSVPSDTYTFEIVNNDSGEDNYSQQFQYEGSGEAVSTTTVETVTSVVETVTPTSSEETSTEASSTTEMSSMTTPSTSAATTVTETETTTATDGATTTSGEGPSSTSEIPAPDDAAMALGSPMTLVVAAVAGLLMFN